MFRRRTPAEKWNDRKNKICADASPSERGVGSDDLPNEWLSMWSPKTIRQAFVQYTGHRDNTLHILALKSVWTLMESYRGSHVFCLLLLLQVVLPSINIHIWTKCAADAANRRPGMEECGRDEQSNWNKVVALPLCERMINHGGDNARSTMPQASLRICVISVFVVAAVNYGKVLEYCLANAPNGPTSPTGWSVWVMHYTSEFSVYFFQAKLVVWLRIRVTSSFSRISFYAI